MRTRRPMLVAALFILLTVPSALVGQSLQQAYVVLLPVVTASPPPPPPNIVANGDFELGGASWKEYSALGYAIITDERPEGVAAHSGTWLAWLAGDDDEIAAIEQPLTVPASARLRYWLWIASEDFDCSGDADIGGVLLDDGTDNAPVVDVYPLCEDTNTGGWVLRDIDLGPYAGRSFSLVFLAGTDVWLASSMLVDDVVIRSSSSITSAAKPSDELAAALRKRAMAPHPAQKVAFWSHARRWTP